MDELIVILGALVTLVLSIAGMNIYRWRTDVLTGPIFRTGNTNKPFPTAEWTEWTRRQRKEPHDAPLPAMLLALNEPRKSTRYSSNRARKATIHAGLGNGVLFEGLESLKDGRAGETIECRHPIVFVRVFLRQHYSTFP